MHQKIYEFYQNSRNSSDEVEKELAQDMMQAAVKYVKYRTDWAFYTVEQKIANDKYRTSAHNHFIDCLNIYLRYLSQKEDIKEVDITEKDRKEIGDLACELVCMLAVSQR